MPRYDAFLLVSFGGPENPDEVIPFLQNVTAGRSIPTGRLAEVAGHYYLFGGVSPLNQQCRDLIAAVGKDFAARGIDLPVYWGNRKSARLNSSHRCISYAVFCLKKKNLRSVQTACRALSILPGDAVNTLPAP